MQHEILAHAAQQRVGDGDVRVHHHDARAHGSLQLKGLAVRIVVAGVHIAHGCRAAIADHHAAFFVKSRRKTDACDQAIHLAWAVRVVVGRSFHPPLRSVEVIRGNAVHGHGALAGGIIHQQAAVLTIHALRRRQAAGAHLAPGAAVVFMHACHGGARRAARLRPIPREDDLARRLVKSHRVEL